MMVVLRSPKCGIPQAVERRGMRSPPDSVLDLVSSLFEHADPIDSVLTGRQLLLIVHNCDGASETDDGVRTPPISDLPGNRREQEDADSADYAGQVGDLHVKMIICVELQRENGRKARTIESAPNEPKRQPWISAARPALAQSD